MKIGVEKLPFHKFPRLLRMSPQNWKKNFCTVELGHFSKDSFSNQRYLEKCKLFYLVK